MNGVEKSGFAEVAAAVGDVVAVGEVLELMLEDCDSMAVGADGDGPAVVVIAVEHPVAIVLLAVMVEDDG